MAKFIPSETIHHLACPRCLSQTAMFHIAFDLPQDMILYTCSECHQGTATSVDQFLPKRESLPRVSENLN